MAGHQWHPLHGDMPMREMHEEVARSLAEGEMPTRAMAEQPIREQVQAADRGIDPELAAYRQQQAGRTPS